MGATKQKIIDVAIRLYNQRGLGNVKVHDIAEAAAISPGNLTYHFKTKKELLTAVYEHMHTQLMAFYREEDPYQTNFGSLDSILRYLKIQVDNRFFYRDALEILHFCPQTRESYEEHMNLATQYIRDILLLAAREGFMVPEPQEGIYTVMAKNSWSLLISWLIEREILGSQRVSNREMVHSLLSMHYPYYTPKGHEYYEKIMQKLSQFKLPDLDRLSLDTSQKPKN